MYEARKRQEGLVRGQQHDVIQALIVYRQESPAEDTYGTDIAEAPGPPLFFSWRKKEKKMPKLLTRTHARDMTEDRGAAHGC